MDRNTKIVGIIIPIACVIIGGVFGLWQGGCNKQEPAPLIEKRDESAVITVQEIHGDNVAGDKNQYFYLEDSSREEKKNSKESNPTTASAPHSNEKFEALLEEELEISIQLSNKSEGFVSVFVDGKRALITASSTPLNPRILIKSNKVRNQLISIVTKSRDTCTLERRFDASQKETFPIRFVPDCF